MRSRTLAVVQRFKMPLAVAHFVDELTGDLLHVPRSEAESSGHAAGPSG